jgi:hypothetical protein
MCNFNEIATILNIIEYIETNIIPQKKLEFERNLIDNNESKIALECLCDEIEDREIQLPDTLLNKLRVVANNYHLKQRYIDVLK